MKSIYVVAALIRRGNQVFACQRGSGPLKGGWEFPGGKIQEGESPQQALAREIEEELESSISVGKYLMTVEYDYPDFHLCMECYWCSLIEGKLELKEHMEGRWLSQEELRQVEWLPADLQIIDKLEEEGFAIRNLVFDVGHVLLSYRWQEMFMEYGLDEKESIRVGEEMFSYPGWTNQFDRGIVTPEELIEIYRQEYPKDQEAIAWFLQHGKDMRVDRPEIWDQVGRLKKAGYHIYLLSNYSEYLFKQHTQEECFLQYLDGKVVSYEPHMIKPEPGIYQYLFAKYQLKAEECLFFDDRYENVEASWQEGMDAVWVSSREMLHKTLKSL